MEIATVVGHVWATKKEDSLVGLKLMIVKLAISGATCVAADVVGAGIGEQVLIVSGSTARKALGSDNCAADCAIVGIIDTIEMQRAMEKNKTARAEEADLKA